MNQRTKADQNVPVTAEMATVNAAKLLGRNDDLGLIRVGSPADISVLQIHVEKERQNAAKERRHLAAPDEKKRELAV